MPPSPAAPPCVGLNPKGIALAIYALPDFVSLYPQSSSSELASEIAIGPSQSIQLFLLVLLNAYTFRSLRKPSCPFELTNKVNPSSDSHGVLSAPLVFTTFPKLTGTDQKSPSLTLT